MNKSDPPIIVEHAYNVQVQKVWEAITHVDKMTQWFFDNIPDFKAEKGFSTQFQVQVEDRTFTHLWKITQVKSLDTLTYNWKYKEYPGDSKVTFKLVRWGDWTLIRLTAQILEDFPSDIPEFTRESCEGGWNYFLKERLKTFLDG
ncbi:MAG: SRPBCC domain-containing protein [Bacteroidota bacterium]